jgi:hypothetical protein
LSTTWCNQNEEKLKILLVQICKLKLYFLEFQAKLDSLSVIPF